MRGKDRTTVGQLFPARLWYEGFGEVPGWMVGVDGQFGMFPTFFPSFFFVLASYLLYVCANQAVLYGSNPSR